MRGLAAGIVLGWAVVALAGTGSALAQDAAPERPTLEQLAGQLERAAERAAAKPPGLYDFGAGGLAWLRARYVEGEALRRLGEEVADHPDHPDRLLWDQSMRRSRGEPHGTLTRLWSAGPGRWRINTTMWQIGDQEHYWDAAIYPGREWWLTRDDMSIFIPGKDGISGSNPRSFSGGALYDLSWLFYGQLDVLATDSISLEGLRWMDGDRFTFRLVRGKPGDSFRYVAVYEARWDRDADRWFIESAEVVEHASRPDRVGQRRELSGWVFAPEIGRWVAGRIVETGRFKTEGGDWITRVLEFRGAHEGDPDELERITRISPVDGADPLRGEVTVRRVRDFREGGNNIEKNPSQRRMSKLRLVTRRYGVLLLYPRSPAMRIAPRPAMIA